MKDVRLGSGSMVIGLALFAGCASDPAMAAGDGAVADAPVTADRPAPSDGGMTVAGGARALHAGSFETVAVTADNAFFRWRYSVRAAMGRPIDDQPIAEVAVAELGHAWRTPGGAVRSLWVPGETSQPMVRERIPGGVEQLVAGRNVFCARLASGEVQCWDRSRGFPRAAHRGHRQRRVDHHRQRAHDLDGPARRERAALRVARHGAATDGRRGAHRGRAARGGHGPRVRAHRGRRRALLRHEQPGAAGRREHHRPRDARRRRRGAHRRGRPRRGRAAHLRAPARPHGALLGVQRARADRRGRPGCSR
jgi:hypothetical protein